MGETLGGLDIALCAFDDDDRCFAWNARSSSSFWRMKARCTWDYAHVDIIDFKRQQRLLARADRSARDSAAQLREKSSC